MKNQTQAMRDQIENQIARFQKDLAMLEKVPTGLIAQAFPQGQWKYTYAHDFEFDLGLDYALVNEARIFMATQFPDWVLVLDKQYTWPGMNQATHMLTYAMEGAEFDFAFRSTMEGTTCVVRQIGTSIQPAKEIPLYEVVCAEGAKESSELP